MGTDIHGVFQRYDGAKWLDVESSYAQNRHYQLFAVLAGVRNGTGFAGVVTGEPVQPIAAPRGLPADFAMDGDAHPIADVAYMEPWRREYYKADEALEIWLGEHSHSWLTGEEMLGWAKNAPTVEKVGVLERSIYEAWDGVSMPSSYSGDVWGGSVVVVNDNAVEMQQTPNWTYVRCRWSSGLREELAYFFDEVKRLAELHGKVRFVFGFDS